MIREITVYSAADTAYVLRAKLGPVREWSDFLADMRRGRTSLYGLVLPPCGHVRERGTKRPVYALTDIAAFIKAVRAKAGSSIDTARAGGRKVRIDDAIDWRLQPV